MAGLLRCSHVFVSNLDFFRGFWKKELWKYIAIVLKMRSSIVLKSISNGQLVMTVITVKVRDFNEGTKPVDCSCRRMKTLFSGKSLS
jgi:hypothetical protein